VSQIEQFANDYQTATGQKLAFLRADIQWSSPTWEQDLEQLAAYCRAQGIAFQVIYDAGLSVDPQYLPANTSLSWAEQALEGMAAIEADPLIRPDAGIISSWNPYPATALPVNSDGSLTYLEQQYANIAPLYRALTSGTGNITPAAITAPIALTAPLGQSVSVSGVSIALAATITSNPTLQVILTAADGVLHVSGSASVKGNGSGGLVLTGTQAQINRALGTLTYTRIVAGPDLLQIVSVGQDQAGDNPLSQLFVAIDNSVASGITIAGNGNGFSATAASLYQIAGDNDLVNVGSVVSAATTVDGNNNTISTAPGATFSVIGDNGTLIFQGSDTLNVTGTIETFVISGSNNVAALTLSSANLNINAGAVGGALTLTSANAGTHTYSNVIALSGAVAVTIDDEAYITINHAAAGDVINIGTGDAQWLDINGGGATINLSCSMQQLNASGETIAAAAGLSFNVAGTADSVVEGAHDVVNVGSATVVANGTTSVVTSSNDSFVLNSGAYLGLLGGTGFSVTANGGTVATWANTGLTLSGSGDHVSLGNSSQLSFISSAGAVGFDTGSKDGFAITATNTAQTVSGFNMSNGDVLDLTGILASSQLAQDLSNIGNYLAVTSSGANTTITITGGTGSDTVQLLGSGALTLNALLSGGAFKLPPH
jgi:hypothetical protein